MTTENETPKNDFNATIGNTVLSAADFTQSPDDNYFYTSKNPLLRYKIVKDYDPIFGGEYWDYRFEIFKRPYLWGMIGKKRWEMSVQTNGFLEGISFSCYLLGCR